MTKRHFEAIASSFRTVVTERGLTMSEHEHLFRVASIMADDFSRFNANFSREKFLTACGF